MIWLLLISGSKWLSDAHDKRIQKWIKLSFSSRGSESLQKWIKIINENSVNFNQPELQRPICRVLLMVPVYSVTSFLSLRFTQYSIYFDTLREWYEAYALYNFMALVLRFLERNYDLRYVLEYKPRQMHIIPFCCLPPFPHGQKFILNCKSGVVQYSFIRTLTTLIALCTQLADKYHEGDFHPQYAYLYIVLINNISQVNSLRNKVLRVSKIYKIVNLSSAIRNDPL